MRLLEIEQVETEKEVQLKDLKHTPGEPIPFVFCDDNDYAQKEIPCMILDCNRWANLDTGALLDLRDIDELESRVRRITATLKWRYKD